MKLLEASGFSALVAAGIFFVPYVLCWALDPTFRPEAYAHTSAGPWTGLAGGLAEYLLIGVLAALIVLLPLLSLGAGVTTALRGRRVAPAFAGLLLAAAQVGLGVLVVIVVKWTFG